MNRGILYGIGAYVLWGLLPIYWKALQSVPAAEILANRMVWSLAVVLLILAIKKDWGWLRPSLQNRRILITYFITACILAVNWFVYIWSVNHNFIVETSLGYFINPLVSVLLGVVFLHEKLRWGQLGAIAIAVIGVVYLTYGYGAVPWIALTLAFTFATYGLLRKTGSLDSSQGLTMETGVLFLPAFAYLLMLQNQGSSAFAQGDPKTTLLLIGAGLATGIPLLLFGAAARRITLTNLGLLQYIAPTLQFMLGVFVYGEAFSYTRLIGFSIIWFALAVYTMESLVYNRHKNRQTILLKESGTV